MLRFTSFRPLVILAIAAIAAFLVIAPGAQAAVTQTYIVLYGATASPANAETAIQKAGGTVVANYSQIGVVIARSDSTSFSAAVQKDSRVTGVSATTNFATRVELDLAGAEGPPPGVLPNSTATDSDNLSGLQWDMAQIQAPEAHAITGGSPQIVVGDIDTGLDYTHPDLAPNVDFANSVSCVGGVPDQDPAAWDDVNGHGTHTAGTIAAASNGVGIVGVAPNVKVAAIKAGNDDGYFFPEAVVCAFMWAATHDIDVTNNSYFADPWLFNCRNDAEQRAIWKAEQRAIRYAMSRGVVVVASEGNENIDLSRRNTDVISPDYPPGSEQEREVTNACVVIPVEIPGVIGVTASGNLRKKAYYSSYGAGTADVIAPGGDRRFQVTAAAPNGRVLSAFPDFVPGNPLFVQDCSVSPCASYVYLQGTSMASPHAAGVAALIMSRFGKLPPGTVSAMLRQTADPLPCPPNPYDPGPPFIFTSICVGGSGYNGFFGHGEVNALSAVNHATSD